MTSAPQPVTADRIRRLANRRIALLREELPLGRNPVVLDVGANPLFPPPYRRLMRLGGCTVVGFEPQADAFEELQKSRGENERYINAALGKPGPATLHVYPSDGFTSLYPMRPETTRVLGRFGRQVANERKVEITLRAMDDIDEISEIDMLKIDVQGAERDIIASGREKLKEAVCIITEVRFYPLYQGEPSWGELDGELRGQGFTLHKFMETKSFTLINSQSGHFPRPTLRSQLMDGDAVYLRSLEGVDDWTDGQIARLALLADAVIDSPDLALRMMDVLVARGAVERSLPARYAPLLVRYQPRAKRGGDE
ncbi:MAG: FkbM family methyltransferase [Paracoccaceae bacterium]